MVEVDGEARGGYFFHLEDFEDGMGFAFHDIEGAATAIHAAAVATRRVVSVVVVDLAAIHVEIAAVDIHAAALTSLCRVVVDAVAVDGDVAFMVVDAATIEEGGVVANTAGLRVYETVAVAGTYYEVALVGVESAAATILGLVIIDETAIDAEFAVMVV